MRLRTCGDAAILVELDDLAQVMALAPVLQAARSSTAGVVDVVPAARTVLVRFDPARTTESEIATWLRATDASGSPIRSGYPSATTVTTVTTVIIAVTYDGPDLDEVGRLTGLGRDGVVAAHTGREWTVAFLGFAPGFAYCAGGDPRLRVPRREVPRERVGAGAVGLADDLTAVYPRASPGGWQIIGHTESTIWDLRRDPPALLTPGTVVKFRST